MLGKSVITAAAGAGGAETDENFNQTVLLLHGDGTNGAQNNTFLDSSTNNFTITRNGNTTQGTFSPFSAPDGRWSNYFDGTGDYLSLADNAALEIGASSFCIESWIYLNALPASGARITIVGKWGSDISYIFQVFNDSGTIKLSFTYSTNGSSVTADLTQAAAITANAWHHVAVTRDSTTLRFFLNGVQQGSNQTVNATFYNGSSAVNIGRNESSNANFPNGYFSNTRLVVGSAVYTETFPPITEPLTTTSQGASSSQVEILTCQSNRFVDNSTNNFAITRNGDVKVTPFSPFAPTAAYSASVNGGSGYFDGTGDYVNLSGASLTPSGVDVTIDFWIYPTATGTNLVIFQTGTDTNGDMQCLFDSSLGIRFQVTGTGGSYNNNIRPNAWNYIVCVKSGTSFTAYVNGVAGNTATLTPNNTTALSVGGRSGGPNMAGYIAGFRFTTGAANVPSGIPTSPPTTTVPSGTCAALLNFTNAGIFDNTGKNVLETVGNAQIDTTTKKYGTGSMEFDGTGDGLTGVTSQDLLFGTGNFTVEWWMYFSDKTGYQTILSFGYTPIGADGWLIQTGNGDGKIVFYKTNAGSTTTIATDTGATVNTGEWYHMAVVRSSGTTTIYRNGVSVGSGADTVNYTRNVNFYIGGGSNTAFDNYYFNGFIDDLRITKGVARYPTEPFPTKAFPDL